MFKEQKRLEKVIVEKQAQIDAQAIDTERLKKMNKVLNQQMANLQSKSKLMAMLEDRDMDTPSSEDSSPKSSFSTKTTKIEIKPRSLGNNELLSPDSSSDMVVTVLPSPTSTSSTTTISTKSALKDVDVTKKATPSLQVTPTSPQHQLGQNVTIGILTTSSPTSRRTQVTPAALSLPINQEHFGGSPELLSPTSSPKKPPIPSRAGVNRKLQKSLPLPPPPPPPPRSSSTKKNVIREDKTDSGRESDDQNTSRLCLNVNDPAFEYIAGQIINSNHAGDRNIPTSNKNKGKHVNFLASSSPKRLQDNNSMTTGGRSQKNFEEYSQTDSIKNKANRQKTYILPSNADEKENKFSNGDRTTDEGFSSSHEDHHQQFSSTSLNAHPGYDEYLSYAGLNQKSIIPSPPSATTGHPPTTTGLCNNTNNQIRTMTNHRAVQKPSDIKNRSKLKSSAISNLAVLEEHQVSGEGQVTTVTYWTEPYL